MIERHDSVVVVTFVRALLPVMQLFALYVLIYGHYGPGGGFQAGVMLGAGYILLALALGREVFERRVNEPVCLALAAAGVSSIRVVPLFLGQGGHVKEDLPRLVERAGAARPGLSIRLEKPIGEQAQVIEAIAAAIAGGMSR